MWSEKGEKCKYCFPIRLHTLGPIRDQEKGGADQDLAVSFMTCGYSLAAFYSSCSSNDDEEEEHLAPADSALYVPDSVPSSEETEPFETGESAATPPPPRSPHIVIPFSHTRLRRARISVRPHTPPSPSTEARIAEYAAAPTPPSPPLSPLSPLSSPLLRIPSPPLLLPPTRPLHTSTTYARALLGYRAAVIPLLLLPLPSPDRRGAIPEADMPPQKRIYFTALSHRFEIRESSATATARQTGPALAHDVDYGFIDTLDASIRAN
ncbi:hypothetical protein Tco_0407566 [Tanacetum coccineum]